jgi:hypothetical protein
LGWFCKPLNSDYFYAGRGSVVLRRLCAGGYRGAASKNAAPMALKTCLYVGLLWRLCTMGRKRRTESFFYVTLFSFARKSLFSWFFIHVNKK